MKAIPQEKREKKAAPRKKSFPGWALAVLSTLLLAPGCNTPAASASIEEMVPPPGSTGMSVDQPVEIRFDLPLDLKTLTKDEIWAQDSETGEEIPIEVLHDEPGSRVTIVPASAWPKERPFRVCLGAGLRSASGGGIDSLRIDPELDLTEPLQSQRCFGYSTEEILTISRAYLLMDEQQMLIYFSRPLDPDSVTASGILLATENELFEAEARYSPTRNRLAIYIPSSIETGKAAALHLPGSIRSSDGQYLGSGGGETLTVRFLMQRVK